jgi:pilus assembly protein CpaE
MPALLQIPDASGAGVLTIALIGPNEQHRKAIAGALSWCQIGMESRSTHRCPEGTHFVDGVESRGQHRLGGADPAESPPAKRLSPYSGVAIREFASYPPADLDDIPKALGMDYDLVIIELDSDPALALGMVRSVYALGQATVMVYSANPDLEMAIGAMRAGAREFLKLPLATAELADALGRVAVRRPAPRVAKGTARKLCVFLGVKGGCGVTTLASNFAVSLAQESGQPTLLIDLGLPLGDVSINLGMVPKYSTANAFQDSSRLDASFLSSLLSEHTSGLQVLAAPSEFSKNPPPAGAIDKLLSIARQNYDYVVVDAGCRIDLKGSALLDDSAIVYLITQIGVSELRNANRMISHFFAHRVHTLQIVLNRYAPRVLGFDEEHITKALTRPAEWRIPDDYATARRTQNTATPIALEDSPISRAIRQMARAACGLSEQPEKKKRFSFFH